MLDHFKIIFSVGVFVFLILWAIAKTELYPRPVHYECKNGRLYLVSEDFEQRALDADDEMIECDNE